MPAPGGVEEGAIQVTPLRPPAPGTAHQLFFMVTDQAGQPINHNPVPADIALTDQPDSPFDTGTVRLMG